MRAHTTLKPLLQAPEVPRRRSVALSASLAIHGLLLLLFTIIVIMPAVRDEPEIVATYVAETRRVSPPLKKLQVARGVQRRAVSAASAQMASIIQAQVASPVGLPQVETPPVEMPMGLGEAAGTGIVPGLGKGTGGPGGPGRGGAFGSTGQMRGAFQGTIYFFEFIDRLRSGGNWFPGRGRRRESGNLYTYSFDIPGRDFSEGFPGISKQTEWFAIDYHAAIDWPASLEGHYEFELKVDDGAILQIDGVDVIDQDGPHGWDAPPVYGDHFIGAGRHTIRLAYYQGPRYYVGLVLRYRKRGEGDWRIFDLKQIIRAGLRKAENPLK